MKKKLSLSEIKIKSFITNLDKKRSNALLGGTGVGCNHYDSNNCQTETNVEECPTTKDDDTTRNNTDPKVCPTATTCPGSMVTCLSEG